MTARLSPREAIVLRLVSEAAARSEPCPTNIALAEALGGCSISVPPRALDVLVERGLISIERFNRSRVVTVLATGQATAGPEKNGHALSRDSAQARRDQLADLVADGVSMAAAAGIIGVSRSRITKMWDEIRAKIGWQAS